MTRVLVIDDEAPIRLLCRVNLEAEGMEVLEASDGPTGLEKARNDEPDVILLDVMMPGLDGWQVAAISSRAGGASAGTGSKRSMGAIVAHRDAPRLDGCVRDRRRRRR